MRRARTNSNRDLPMSSLERRQRGLLDLVKNRGSATGDPYLHRVANSRQLAMVRKIALWWRAVSLEAQCRLTAGGLIEISLGLFLAAPRFCATVPSCFLAGRSPGVFARCAESVE